MVPARLTWRTGVVWVSIVVVALVLGWVAAFLVIQPPRIESNSARPVTVEAVKGSISVEQPYGVNANWNANPIGANQYGGVLTELRLESAGTEVRAGDILYSVNMDPVIAAVGNIPSFRELSLGAQGEDVKQLQQLLKTLGFSSAEPNGTFSTETQAAVQLWNESLGVASSDRVPFGRIVFLPRLPTVIAPAPDVRIGSLVSAGQAAIIGATDQPEFSFRVLPENVDRTKPGLPVVIDANGAQWRAEVDRLERATDDSGATVAILRPVPGQDSICGDTCGAAVSIGEKSMLPARLIIAPKTDGIQVPTAAIVTNASGTSQVITENGDAVDVTVKVSDQGRSIISGIRAGQRIQIPGATD